MSDEKTGEERTLGQRVEVLETRLTYQDETIEILNKTITEQWKQIDALTRQVAALKDRIQEAEVNVPGPANERPPHY